ncbi:VWA domain-containing protein [Crocinitomix catalasitica]|nr:VWA domain-containing protein [Crocinitomix catalasitica]
MKNNLIKTKAIFSAIIFLHACGAGDGRENVDTTTTPDNNVLYDTAEEYYESAESDDWGGEGAEELFYDEIAGGDFNTEEYDYLPENDFLSPGVNPLSTFSIDVDNASYTNVRRMITQGDQPPVDAVRTEEFINYFNYNYPIPEKDEVFSIYTELGECPWNSENQLVHIGLKGYTVPIEDLPPANLVFLLDVSGSMDEPNKLPLLKKSFKLLVDKLNGKDRVSIVTYAGDERLVLESTSCKNKKKIKAAIDNLESGGSTNGEGGIEMAYEQALDNFLEEGNNRVILATDGDFNIGRSSGGELTRLIEAKRDKGVYLTILGFGMGNYKDSKMESLADHGNGNYFYIDGIRESNRVLVTNLAGTLFTIAKDVKIQVEFNPNLVAEYRLIGYENRLMNAEDFADDKKDAGELGAGHTVTAIYEIVPGKAKKANLKYQSSSTAKSDELVTVRLRYKKPDQTKSRKVEVAIKGSATDWDSCSEDYKFSAAVAGFSLILRESKYIGNFSYDDVIAICMKSVKITDREKVDFIEMVENAKLLSEV